MPEEPGPPVEFSYNRLEGLRAHARDIPFRHDNHVDPLWHLAPVEAEVLSKPSLYTIPDHRTTELASDCQAEPPPGAATAAHEEAEASAGNLFGAPYYFSKFPRSTNPMRPGKMLLVLRLRPRHLYLRNCEALSPLCPPPIQDQPTSCGLHPAAKSVGTLSFDAARLIRSLHPPPPQWRRPTKSGNSTPPRLECQPPIHTFRPDTRQKTVVIGSHACYAFCAVYGALWCY